MSRGAWIGVGGTARRVKRLYVGVNGTARRVRKGYVGVNGVARRFWGGELVKTGTTGALSQAKYLLAGTCVGAYALFGGGVVHDQRELTVATVDAIHLSGTTVSAPWLSMAKYGFDAATIGNYALFGSGFNGSGTDNYVDAYNASLTKVTPEGFVSARNAYAAACVGNYALFGGGYGIPAGETVGGVSGDVDAYDDAMTHLTPSGLTKPRQELAAAGVGNYALFVGGLDGDDQALVWVDAYNSSLTCTHLNPGLDYVRCDLAGATAAGAYAVFAGGRDVDGAVDKVEAYNASLTRVEATALSTAVYSHAGSSCEELAVFAGGRDGSGEKNAVNTYNDALTRSICTPLSSARYALAAAALEDYLLIAGGGVSGSTAKSDVVDIYQFQ